MKEIHLGDGAYARYDGSELVIYTSNGIHTTNSVYLEQPAISALLAFLAEAVRR